MDTYLLTGNPEKGGEVGLNKTAYRVALESIARDGFAKDEWTMWDSKSQSGDQVVLYRAGRKRAGLIGFGARREGEPKLRQGDKSQNSEYPVIFYNLRPLDEDPYISLTTLKEHGFLASNNLQRGGLKLDEKQLHVIETCCIIELGFPLSQLCSSYLRKNTSIEIDFSSSDADTTPFDPRNIIDARETILRAIKARRGQKFFRDSLISAYGGRCALTGCGIADVLEAAHIVPYLGPETNDITNGILLRADIHTLLDCGLLGIDPATRAVILSPTLLSDPDYKHLHKRVLRRPHSQSLSPSEKALLARARQMGQQKSQGG